MAFEQFGDSGTSISDGQTSQLFLCAYGDQLNAKPDPQPEKQNQSERELIDGFAANDANAMNRFVEHLQRSVGQQPNADPERVIQGILDRMNEPLSQRAGIYFHVGQDRQRNIVVGGPLSGRPDTIVIRR